MSTLGEILFGKKGAIQDSDDSANSESSAIKGTAEWAQNNSGENAVSDSSSVHNDSSNNSIDPPDKSSTENPDKSGGSATSSSDAGGYTKILQTMYPDMEMTKEQKEKALKKERRDKIFAALGDGLSALANIYFASQYAPDMSSKSTLSKAVQEKYDKADKEKKWYMEKKMEAQSKDDEKAYNERAWQRQLGIDEENRQWREDQKKAQQEAAVLAQEQFNWKKEESERKQKEKENEKAEAKKAAAEKAKRDKTINRTVFADGNGNEVSIDKDVFSGSLQQVFNQLVADGIGNDSNDEKDKTLYLMMMNRMTPQQQEDFVKKHWTESPKAKKTMLYLSKLDPGNLQSKYLEDSEKVPDNDNIAPYLRKEENTTDDNNTPPSWRKTN